MCDPFSVRLQYYFPIEQTDASAAAMGRRPFPHKAYGWCLLEQKSWANMLMCPFAAVVRYLQQISRVV